MAKILRNSKEHKQGMPFENVDNAEVISLLLGNGRNPETILHLGDPETDATLAAMGVKLDRAHRTLLRTAIRAYARDKRARVGTLLGWDSGSKGHEKEKNRVTLKPQSDGRGRRGFGEITEKIKASRESNTRDVEEEGEERLCEGSAFEEFQREFKGIKMGDKEKEFQTWQAKHKHLFFQFF